MSTIKDLGYSENDKLLIIHADDAGLSHSQNIATIRALEQGVVKSYSIMTPCPMFEEIAEFAKANPKFDYGIHLTLTAEWNEYRFRPVLSREEIPSLVDESGFFFQTLEDLKNNARSTEVDKELRAQINKAISFGLNPTHLDSHMFSLGVKKEFFEIYINLARDYKLPALLTEQFIRSIGLYKDEYRKNFLFSDNVYMAGYNDFEKSDLAGYYDNVLDNLTPGFNILIIHPAFDNSEMESITGGEKFFGSKWRQIDFDYFTSEKCKSKLLKNNIKLISWKEISNMKER